MNPLLLNRTKTLRRAAAVRDKVLIYRKNGGLGDILVQRMLFGEVKALDPSIRLFYACPTKYRSAVADHPALEAVLDVEAVDRSDFGAVYDISTVCRDTECRSAPYPAPNRSDIWAATVGLTLRHHDMQLSFRDGEVAAARRRMVHVAGGRGPLVAFSPVSAMNGKNLDQQQASGVLAGLRRNGFCPVVLHTSYLEWLDCPQLTRLSIRQWMACVASADLVVSVDSACFHMAGGAKRPLVGVFSFADGAVYGKYYDFTLVQRHRSYTAGWNCGPCYNWTKCPKSPNTAVERKPCITEILPGEVVSAAVQEWRRKSGRAEGVPDLQSGGAGQAGPGSFRIPLDCVQA